MSFSFFLKLNTVPYLCISTPCYNYHYSRNSNIASLLACWVVISWRTSSSLLFWHLEYYLACNWYTACTNAWLNEVYETKTVTILKKNIITISFVTGLPVAFHESSWCFSDCVDNDTYQISCGQNGIAYKITVNLTNTLWDFPDGPMIKTHSQCRGHRFASWLGN